MDRRIFLKGALAAVVGAVWGTRPDPSLDALIDADSPDPTAPNPPASELARSPNSYDCSSVPDELVLVREHTPKCEPELVSPGVEEQRRIKVRVSHYCNCRVCCGKYAGHPAYGITASGRRARRGYVAAPKEIPLGSRINIDGVDYLVADRGGAIRKFGDVYRIDVWCPTHSEAKRRGVYETTAVLEEKI